MSFFKDQTDVTLSLPAEWVTYENLLQLKAAVSALIGQELLIARNNTLHTPLVLTDETARRASRAASDITQLEAEKSPWYPTGYRQ